MCLFVCVYIVSNMEESGVFGERIRDGFWNMQFVFFMDDEDV
jgi:hypothetical protein